MIFSFLKRVNSSIFLILLACLTLTQPFLLVWAQTPPAANVSPLDLELVRVQKGTDVKDTKLVSPQNWSTDEVLNLDDTIRYRWKNVVLDEKYKTSPAPNAGYLRVYKDDETKPENFLADNGSSPFSLSKVSGKLQDGDQKLIFLYVDSSGNPVSTTKSTITFKFQGISTKPSMKILSPETGSLFAKNLSREFNIELTNISLDISDTPQQPKGKVSVYFNEVKPENFLSAFSRSTDLPDKKALLKFDTTDASINWERIPDSLNTKLIFSLTNVKGDPLGIEQTLEVKTNYQNQINLGLPRVSIVEPKQDRSDTTTTSEQKFILKVENFELLGERSDKQKDGKSGYLQILIDDAPYKIIWGKQTFSLNEIGYIGDEEGRRTVKVQLVNTDFTKLDSPSSDTREIIHKPSAKSTQANQNVNEEDTVVASNSWRTIIIILTIILIVGGIAIIITKG
jgi:hypothetical protein